MSSFSSLKTAIANAIKQNGNQEITGNLLQGILLSIVETLGDSAINTLETGLSSEATARSNADTQLNNLITGVKNNIDNGYVYAGIAIPTTSPVSGKVFYIATKAGTYTNLGGLSVTEGITILKYNGSTWSKEQVIYGDGGVYDVTAQNGGATFASLEALLGSDSLSTLIPTAVRKGGMSIKFVQTSDNKYVQYRFLLSGSFTDEQFAKISNWVSDECEQGLNLFNSALSNGIGCTPTTVGQVTELWRYTSSAYKHCEISIGENVTFSINSCGNTNRPALLFLDKDDKILEGSIFSETSYNYAYGQYTTPVGCRRMVVNFITSQINNPYIYINTEDYIKYNVSNSKVLLKSTNKIQAFTASNSIRIPTPFTIYAGSEVVEFADNSNHYIELAKVGSTNYGVVCYDSAHEVLKMVASDAFDVSYNILFSFNEDVPSLSLPEDMYVYNNKVAKKEYMFDYLVSSNPTEDVDIECKGTTVNIKFPARNLRIYDQYGSYVVGNTSEQTYTLGILQALVYIKSTNTVDVVNINEVTDEHIVLFRYGYSSMDGLLSSFLFRKIEKVGFNDYTGFIKDTNGVTVGSNIGDVATMTKYTSNNYKHLIFEAKAGTEIYYMGRGEGTRTPIAFVDKDTKVILAGSIVGSGTQYAAGIYKAPSDCLVVINAVILNKYQLYIKGLDNELFNDYVKGLVLNANDFIESNYNKERDKLQVLKSNSDLTLAHFSDIHDDGVAVDSIMGLLNKGNFVDDVLHTGDNVAHKFSDGISNLASATDWGNILNVVGNHDGAVLSDGSYVWNGEPVKNVYDLLFAPYISNWGVTQPTGAATNGYCYYYKDYASKVRMIVINESYWDNTQKTWFEGLLADALTQGLAVVGVKHSRLGFDSEPILCSFNNRFKDADKIFNVAEARTAVDSFIENGGEFICWLAGHGHVDNVIKYTNNNRLQIAVLIGTSNRAHLTNDTPKIDGTEFETLFNIVGFNTTNKLIKVGRIGACLDKFARKCDCMCIDYTTGDVIYDK